MRFERAPFELSPDPSNEVHVEVPAAACRPGAFVMAVDSDCMTPLYRDGDYVICWPVPHHSEVEHGHPCALLLSGGHWLLKQVFHLPEHPRRLVLRARNRRHTPGDIIVHVEDVVGIARAVYRVAAPAIRSAK